MHPTGLGGPTRWMRARIRVALAPPSSGCQLEASRAVVLSDAERTDHRRPRPCRRAAAAAPPTTR